VGWEPHPSLGSDRRSPNRPKTGVRRVADGDPPLT
jgi:hypothetical protein